MELGEARLGFIGAGNMAQAIAGGLIKQGLVPASHVTASAPSDANLATWSTWGARTTHNNVQLVRDSDIVFLAVKPHVFERLADAPPHASDCPLKDCAVRDRVIDGRLFFVSVMAGVTVSRMQQVLCAWLRVPTVCVIRCMPSTPCQLAAGCCCYCLPASDDAASTSEVQLNSNAALVERVFSALGVCRRLVSEQQMNAACGAFGSGVAFLLVVIDALASAAVRAGLSWDVARVMAAQTAVGAGQMALVSGRHVAQLRDEVSSPGGTTIAGLHALETAGVRAGVMQAVQAAVERGDQLGAGKRGDK